MSKPVASTSDVDSKYVHREITESSLAIYNTYNLSTHTYNHVYIHIIYTHAVHTVLLYEITILTENDILE